jgi:hypothetical protein
MAFDVGDALLYRVLRRLAPPSLRVERAAKAWYSSGLSWLALHKDSFGDPDLQAQ